MDGKEKMNNFLLCISMILINGSTQKDNRTMYKIRDLGNSVLHVMSSLACCSVSDLGGGGAPTS